MTPNKLLDSEPKSIMTPRSAANPSKNNDDSQTPKWTPNNKNKQKQMQLEPVTISTRTTRSAEKSSPQRLTQQKRASSEEARGLEKILPAKLPKNLRAILSLRAYNNSPPPPTSPTSRKSSASGIIDAGDSKTKINREARNRKKDDSDNNKSRHPIKSKVNNEGVSRNWDEAPLRRRLVLNSEKAEEDRDNVDIEKKDPPKIKKNMHNKSPKEDTHGFTFNEETPQTRSNRQSNSQHKTPEKDPTPKARRSDLRNHQPKKEGGDSESTEKERTRLKGSDRHKKDGEKEASPVRKASRGAKSPDKSHAIRDRSSSPEKIPQKRSGSEEELKEIEVARSYRDRSSVSKSPADTFKIPRKSKTTSSYSNSKENGRLLEDQNSVSKSPGDTFKIPRKSKATDSNKDNGQDLEDQNSVSKSPATFKIPRKSKATDSNKDNGQDLEDQNSVSKSPATFKIPRKSKATDSNSKENGRELEDQNSVSKSAADTFEAPPDAIARPTAIMIAGYDVEAMVDAAMGLREISREGSRSGGGVKEAVRSLRDRTRTPDRIPRKRSRSEEDVEGATRSLHDRTRTPDRIPRKKSRSEEDVKDATRSLRDRTRTPDRIPRKKSRSEEEVKETAESIKRTESQSTSTKSEKAGMENERLVRTDKSPKKRKPNETKASKGDNNTEPIRKAESSTPSHIAEDPSGSCSKEDSARPDTIIGDDRKYGASRTTSVSSENQFGKNGKEGTPKKRDCRTDPFLAGVGHNRIRIVPVIEDRTKGSVGSEIVRKLLSQYGLSDLIPARDSDPPQTADESESQEPSLLASESPPQKAVEEIDRKKNSREDKNQDQSTESIFLHPDSESEDKVVVSKTTKKVPIIQNYALPDQYRNDRPAKVSALPPILLNPTDCDRLPPLLQHLPRDFKVDVINRRTGFVLSGEDAIAVEDLPDLLRKHASFEPIVPPPELLSTEG
jgi:hypothetical protein